MLSELVLHRKKITRSPQAARSACEVEFRVSSSGGHPPNPPAPSARVKSNLRPWLLSRGADKAGPGQGATPLVGGWLCFRSLLLISSYSNRLRVPLAPLRPLQRPKNGPGDAFPVRLRADKAPPLPRHDKDVPTIAKSMQGLRPKRSQAPCPWVITLRATGGVL